MAKRSGHTPEKLLEVSLDEPDSSPETRERLRKTVERHTESFRAALRTSVKVVMGSDTFELPGTNAQEIVAMARAGMSPAEALRSATSRAADLLGLAGRVGVVQKEGGRGPSVIVRRTPRATSP